jgi:hypothetical protein
MFSSSLCFFCYSAGTQNAKGGPARRYWCVAELFVFIPMWGRLPLWMKCLKFTLLYILVNEIIGSYVLWLIIARRRILNRHCFQF